MVAKTYIRDVYDRIKDGNLEGACALLAQASEEQGEFFLYHELMGDVFALAGRRVDAYERYEIALLAKPAAQWIVPKINRLFSGSPDFAGVCDFYPDETGARQAEGGLRTRGHFKSSTSECPLVTVVTALYNNADTLQRCIDSVKVQTYPNIEYIVIDGASSADTLDIVRKNESFIDYYISEPDCGIYAAMNKGIRLARGNYICLLNSDDFYDARFVSEAMEIARETGSDVVYTDYFADDKLLRAQEVGPGILFGHLNICHNTFLTSKACYDRIGPYCEQLSIVSDAVWVRRAFNAGVKFARCPKSLFTLTSGGASSGSTPESRKRFIAEAVRSYRMNFPSLTADEAEDLYLFRFNVKRTSRVREITANHVHDPEFKAAIRGYVEHCFRDRDNFRLDYAKLGGAYIEMTRLIDAVGLDEKIIQLTTKHGEYADILTRIDNIIARRKFHAKKTILHFVTVFSAPSETFIYDLIRRLDSCDDFDNFVLFEHLTLKDERPYNKSLQVPWNDVGDDIGKRIYKYILRRLRPDVVVGHFAINAHRFAMKTGHLGEGIPTVVMTHGIDVFKLKEASDYSEFVTGRLSRRSNVQFTAVSKYLKEELVSSGIPDEKVTIVHNTVNEQFFAHRKSDNFFDNSRPLRILCVGRLIRLKGHRFLIQALHQFVRTCSTNVELTIVYGDGDDQLLHLKQQIKDLDIEGYVCFKAFVNFHVQPDYYSQFDCLVHPSTYADDPTGRGETFGVSVLEAIAAGLPVIVTDAGGVAEVVGYESSYSRIVPHADSTAICEALVDLYTTRTAFADNRAYASERLRAFSPESQVGKLSRLAYKATSTKIKAALFSSSTMQGAGYAAFRLHNGLRHTTVAPTLFTTVRNHKNEPGVEVVLHPSSEESNWRAPQLAPKPGNTIFTIDHPSHLGKNLSKLVERYDVINLHWYARFLTVEDIAALTHLDKPVVMTVRDMLPLTGGCHYFHGCGGWMSNCSDCPQIPTGETGLPTKVLSQKRSDYNFANLTLVALSEHTRSIIAKAPYFKDCRIEVIANSIETDVFRPYEKAQVRHELGLPQHRPIIGYAPSYSSEVKGYREILQAFHFLNEMDSGMDPFVLLIGNRTPATDEIEFDNESIGYIADKHRLARAYAAADVVVVPSLEETFSNTTAEAISCGVPVVGFKTGAIPDLAIDGETGYTADIGDAEGLAQGIYAVLAGPDLSENCRRLAEEVLAFDMQAKRYEELFHELVANRHRQRAVSLVV